MTPCLHHGCCRYDISNCVAGCYAIESTGPRGIEYRIVCTHPCGPKANGREHATLPPGPDTRWHCDGCCFHLLAPGAAYWKAHCAFTSEKRAQLMDAHYAVEFPIAALGRDGIQQSLFDFGDPDNEEE